MNNFFKSEFFKPQYSGRLTEFYVEQLKSRHVKNLIVKRSDLTEFLCDAKDFEGFNIFVQHSLGDSAADVAATKLLPNLNSYILISASDSNNQIDQFDWASANAAGRFIVVELATHDSLALSRYLSVFKYISSSRIFFVTARKGIDRRNDYCASDIYRFEQRVRLHLPSFKLNSFSPILNAYISELSTSHLAQCKFTYENVKSKPTYSFVIPTFNNGHFLTECLRFISNLDAESTDFEVIVVDDGSRAGMSEEVKEAVRHLRPIHIKYFYWPKTAPNDFRAGAARNIGATHARGEILIFLDSDMLLPKDFLHFVKSDLQTGDVVQFVRKHITPEKSTAGVEIDRLKTEDLYIEEKSYWNTLFKAQDWMKLQNFWKFTCTYCLAMSAEVYWAAGGITENFPCYGFEDTDLGYKLFRQNRRFRISRHAVFHLTDRFNIRKALSRRKLLSRSAERFYFNHLESKIYLIFKSLLSRPAIIVRRSWRRIINFTRASKSDRPSRIELSNELFR